MMSQQKIEELGIIKSPAVRKALSDLHKLLVGGMVVLLVLIFVVGYAAYGVNEESEDLQRDVVSLQATVTSLESRKVEREMLDFDLQQELDIARTQIDWLLNKVDELEDLQPTTAKPVETTSEDTAVVPMFRVEVTNFGAMNRGNGAFTIRLEVIEDVNGPYTREEARSQIERLSYVGPGSITDLCNTDGREFDHFGLDDGIGRQLQSLGGEEPLTEGCWELLESISGEIPSPYLPPKAVATLQSLTGPGVGPAWHYTLLLDGDGWIIGRWGGDFPEDTLCLERSMEAVGWTSGGEYFTVDPQNDDVFRVLYDEAFVSWREWSPLIPDFCESANLSLAEIPDWLEYQHSNDAHTVTAGSMEVRIHTDAGICTEYPDAWSKGKYLVEVNEDPIATIFLYDLVLIEVGFGDLGYMVYVRPLPDGTLEWLEPAGEGPESTSFQAVPAIWANPNIDGIAPWVSFGGASDYVVGGKVFTQSAPEPFAK